MVKQIDLPYEAIRENTARSINELIAASDSGLTIIGEARGISNSFWRTLKLKANNDAKVFDELINNYIKGEVKKVENKAKRPTPIPASSYDGYILSKDEWQLMIFDYIPTAMKSIFNKKYYLKNITKLGSMEDLCSEVFMEIAVRVRPRSGKTMYEKYLDNVNLLDSYKRMVYRAAENLITDRINVGVNSISFETLVYSEDSEVTIGDLIRDERNEHMNIYVNELMEKCKDMEINGISLYSIAKRLVEDVNKNNKDIRLSEICKEYKLNVKRVREMFEEIGAREILG